MANGFDRLERFFTSKRRASPARSVGRPESPICPPAEPQFPSPSFIRPKATRMAAREEVRLLQASGRSPSVPDIASHRLGSSHSRNSGLTHSPVRSPSLSSRRPEPLATGLREFQFPSPPSRNGEITPQSMTFNIHSSEIPQIPSPRSRSPLHMSVLPRLDTPPSSNPEEHAVIMANMKSSKALDFPYGAPPTPGDSPQLGPVPDSLIMPDAGDILRKTLLNGFEHELGDCFDQFSLNETYSESSLAPSARLSCCSSTLREPDFYDFLNLSDDDIAETTPECPDVESPLEPQPLLPSMALSISSSKPLSSSLLTLTPPRASRPATAAAFEAARIANRYDFDLVYVVNLWPGSSRDSTFGDELDTSERPLIGRLLAAHGLHHVPSPLQISSFVHTTILRSDGWIEYRNQEARPTDLARGYACAFYTGQYTRSGSNEPSSPVSGVRLSEKIDRGIVFAAYRKPRIGESKLGHSLSEEELGDLHRDAEVLVEMLIDIHVANRLRQPPSHHRLSDDTGPMPVQMEVA